MTINSSKKCDICSTEKLKVLETVESEHYINLYQEVLKLDVSMYFEGIPKVEILKCSNCSFTFFSPKKLQGQPEFYERLSHSEHYFNQDKWEFTEALESLKSGMKVLEVGCGNGAFIKRAHEKGIDIVGLDTSPVKLDFAEVINSTIEEYNEDHQEEFDAVVAFQVLEHLTDIKSFVEACLKAVKKGGVLMYAVPNNRARVLRLDPKNCLNMPPHHMALFTEESLKNMCDHFEVDLLDWKAEPLSKAHYKRYYRINIVHLRKKLGVVGKAIDKFLYPFSEKLVHTFRRFFNGQAMLVKYKKT